ncbi:MAG: T9SS type A sorting domain-containing protein [Cryomorphaceae bacterium]|nr:T9SS type A sorting domain-containing protein [Cryomorphaceae bacterium]
MKHLFTIVLSIFSLGIWAQGLENVFVETYYVSDANDATDTDGGNLPPNSVTYRIFVDMAPGYELQAIYGNTNHEARIETTTFFFNNLDRGEISGDMIPANRLDENTVALDSWVGMSGASGIHLGVPKNMDTNGSIIGGDNNDGGSEGISTGLLINNDPLAGIPLTTADGLITGFVPTVTAVGLDLSMFAELNSSVAFSSNGGAWSVLEGVQGPTPENIVLIAQITTDGELEFHLNLQLGILTGGVEQYVSSNPTGNEQFFNALNYPLLPVFGCTSPTACNYDVTAEEEDGSCIEPTANCEICNATNTGLVLVDTDGDGICNAQEIPGCTTSTTACNYNPNATDEVPCLEPIMDCTICNGVNLILVDTDGDGVCDADEVSGCMDNTACNYSATATDDDGGCLIPVANCSVCNANNDGLDLIDTDGDGICDALENPGCFSATACNYNSEATSDDGSCIEPIENCQICNETNTDLIILDTDGDGICDAQDMPGCMSLSACNYNPFALQDDGSCLEPIDGCSDCNDENTALVLIDTDGDGVCDGEEIAGCTSSSACNYNDAATDEDESCIEPIEDCYACNETNDGLDFVDTDGDGICDGEEIFGCTNPEAENYNPEATEDDGSCIVSVEEIQSHFNFSVTPNPTNGALQLNVSSNIGGVAQIQVLNLMGQVILVQDITITAAKKSFFIDLSGKSAGVYFVRTGLNDSVVTQRVIKE